jgi:hypothetical protein
MIRASIEIKAADESPPLLFERAFLNDVGPWRKRQKLIL